MSNALSTIPQVSESLPEHQPLGSANNEFKRITTQLYSQNLALAQTNGVLSILRTIDLLIIEASRDLPQLSRDISRAIVGAYSYAMVSIFSLPQHGDKSLQFQGVSLNSADPSLGYRSGIYTALKDFTFPMDGGWITSPLRNMIIDLSNPDQVEQIAQLSPDASKLLASLSQQFNLKSLYLTKLKARGTTTGVMVVGLDEQAPKIDDIELIERVSEPTGIALDNRLLYEENTRIVSQLHKANDHLKEIDASKDEFISMASHQLRTPLTTMKGTVSMVLEGDVGAISTAQRSLLQQAFDSSQRMVYLIADLLNVSRLQTGKFVIMPKETDLVAVVIGELQQLVSNAQARGVEFRFVEPKTFPRLWLDETKVRQVIMNFLDNALYYTPRGGHVDVVLSATDTAVSYTVTDTGLGVPKAAQPNLFTKFYRAPNAQKARPDGTGLGLYMARKVIVAQGGSIIFSSVEGKGSTFGFYLPLAKVQLPPADAKSAT